MTGRPPITLVTGFSGAGMSSVLKALEDMGHEVFDNFPLSLVDALMKQLENSRRPVAIGIDTRTRGFETQSFIETAKRLNAKLLFIACDDGELQRRFSETRRRHPLAKDRPVRVGIEQEHVLLDPVRAAADLAIDTTSLSVHDLRHILEGHFAAGEKKKLAVTLMSFGFKHGLPREADIVMDVRFLKNPHWVDDLRPLTGKDQAVGDYIEKDKAFADWLGNFQTMLRGLFPRYMREGKMYLTIAIGCTGGRHRSVYTVRKMADWINRLPDDPPIALSIDNRDLR